MLSEIQFLTFILNTQDWNIVTDNDIDASYFPKCKDQFEYIERFVEKYKKVPDIVTFFGTFPSFESIEVTDTAEALLDNLKYSKIQNYTVETFNNIKKQLNSNSGNHQASIDKISSMSQSLNELITTSQSLVYNDASTLKEMMMQTFNEREQNIGSHFYPTGLSWFNEIFTGWDKDSDYVVVAGRPGTGKSMLLCKFAAELWKQGKKVAFYEGEMGLVQTMERIVASLSGISSTDMLKGNRNIKQEYFGWLNHNMSKLKGSMNILTPQDIGSRYATVAQLETFCKKTGADVLIIDQQSLMTDREYARTSFEKAANISRQIKALRDKLNIPVLTAVQMNRTQNENGAIDTRQLAGSDVIAQDATKVIMLIGTTEEDEIEAHIVKNRSGRSYIKQKYRVDFSRCKFEEIENDYNDDSEQLSLSPGSEDVF